MIISIINNKGGTGKTTTCVNLSAALAKKGCRVLLVDLDSQASASISLGYNHKNDFPSIANVFFDDVDIKSAIQKNEEHDFDIITGSMDLADADLILAENPDRSEILLNILDEIKDNYEFILCDSPPSLSSIFINSLIASDSYIVPMTLEYLSLEGFVNLMSVIDRIERNMDYEINLMGILFTMVSAKFKRDRQITREIMKIVKEEYGDLIFGTKIVKSNMISEAPFNHTSIFEYAPHSIGAKAYSSLADEIIERSGIQID